MGFVWISLGALLVGAWLFGAYRLRAETRSIRTQLAQARRPIQPPNVDFRELDGVPPSVQRYLRAALTDGQPMVAQVHLRHRGTFNMSGGLDQWVPFASNQQVVTQRPGFDWEGRVRIAPGTTVQVHDAYAAGVATLHASLLGLISLAKAPPSTSLARDELMRFLAEATWYPTALLPSQGVVWKAVDDRSASATLTDGDISATLLFMFDETGMVATVYAAERGRMKGGESLPTPWRGRFWDYVQLDGMQVPMQGEVGWLLAEGDQPYWRGKIDSIAHEFAS